MFSSEYCKQTNIVIIILYPIFIEDSDCSKVVMVGPAFLHATSLKWLYDIADYLTTTLIGGQLLKAR